jgi:hypothetical protein
MTHPILDVSKVNAADMVRQAATTASNWDSATGNSVTELFNSLNVSAGVEYKGVLFSGKVEAEFSTSSSSKATTKYAKGRGTQVTKDEYLKNTSPSKLKDLLDDIFRTDISTKSAAYILDTYGTHLIARCYWGGSAEFNYSYTGTELSSETDIKAALSATYAGFTGNTSTDAKNKASELNEKSSFTSSSRGGNNTAFMSAEAFTNGYSNWVSSVKKNPDICGIPNFSNDLIPIWQIAAEVSAGKGAEIKAEFDRRATTRGVALEGFKYVPPEPVYTYVTAIDVQNFSHTSVPSGYTNLVKTDMYNPDGGEVLDANKGNTGWYLRIPYKREYGNNNHNAIAELKLRYGPSSAPYESGWTTIGLELNKGVVGSYVWLLYRRVNSGDTMAIDFIGSYCEGSAGSGQILSGYDWVNTWERVDLNKGAIGKYIYLTVHKVPFKW